MSHRPKEYSHPHVWMRFEKVMKDGTTQKFKVQDVPEEMEDDVIDFMINNFAIEEPLCIAGEVSLTTEGKMSHINFWKNIVLPQKLSLICLKDSEESETKPTIVGVNFLILCEKNEELPLDELNTPLKLLVILKDLLSRVDIFKTFRVSEYLGAVGLCVNKEFRGMNIGKEILLTRTPLCAALGYKVTETLFSAVASQVLAEKAGFRMLMEIKYSDLEETHKAHSIKFPKESKSLKIMTKTFE